VVPRFSLVELRETTGAGWGGDEFFRSGERMGGTTGAEIS